MSAIFQELWIFSKDGIPIVDFCDDKCIDKSLLGAFFSAIKTFSKSISGEGLESFKMDNKKYTIVSALEGNAIIVVRTDLQIKDKKIQKLFYIIVKIFEETFKSDEIINWNGDTSFFDEFKKKLDIYFKMGNL